MRMHARTAWLVGWVVVGWSGAARADDVEIRVDDLLRRSAPERDLRFFPWPDPSGEFTGLAEPAEPVAPFTTDALLEAVSTLAGGVDVAFAADERHVVCSEETADLVRSAVARLRAQRPPRVDVEFELSGGADAAVVLAARERVEPGAWFTVAEVASRSMLTDFDVELAQAAEIPDPIVQVVPSGAYLRFRVLPLPNSADAVVELDCVASEPLPAAAMVPGWVGTAPLDRIRTGVDRTVVPIRVRAGEPALCEWTGRDGHPRSLRLTARWTPPAADPGPLVWSSLLTASIGEFWFVPNDLVAAGAEEALESPRFGRAAEGVPAFGGVDAVLGTQTTELAAAGGTGFALFRGPGAKAARDAVVAQIGEGTRATRLTIAVWDVPRGAEVRVAETPGDGTAPSGGRLVLRGSAPVLLGHNAVFVAGEASTYLQDWDVEVATASSIADPIIGSVMTGVFANVAVHPGPGGGPASGEADLDLTIARLDAMASQEVRVPVPAGAATGTIGGDSSTQAGVTAARAREMTSYFVEKPVTRSTRVRTRIGLSAAGAGSSRRTVPGLLGAGRELVVVVRAE